MTQNELLNQLKASPETVQFNDVIAVVDESYAFEPTAFDNGELHNAAGENNGSCKVFSFAMIHDLDESQTLHCFGTYYRDDVLGDPDGDNHQNIRNFMRSGWAGLRFEGSALSSK